MKTSKRAQLKGHGWRAGSAAEFLDLTPEEAAFVETKLALSSYLRDRRTAQNVSQTVLAKRLKSSQSRVAKMEAADATVSIDLRLKALFALWLPAKRRRDRDPETDDRCGVVDRCADDACAGDTRPSQKRTATSSASADPSANSLQSGDLAFESPWRRL
jgi:transcriptional regulator with XRE-family HTH domain